MRVRLCFYQKYPIILIIFPVDLILTTDHAKERKVISSYTMDKRSECNTKPKYDECYQNVMCHNQMNRIETRCCEDMIKKSIYVRTGRQRL